MIKETDSACGQNISDAEALVHNQMKAQAC